MSSKKRDCYLPEWEQMNNEDINRHLDHYFSFRVKTGGKPFDPVAYMRTGKGDK